MENGKCKVQPTRSSYRAKKSKVTGIELYKREVTSWMLDPRDQFARKCVTFEVRRDFLTGHVSRILPFRWRLTESKIDPAVLEASRENCPFCPGQLFSVTPKFVPEVAPEGRLTRGRATLFPNSFPYAQYSGVVALCEEHFLYPEQFTVEALKDGFGVAQEGIERVRKQAPEFEYSSINWNYLPQAGGGLYHPHLQIVVDKEPTASQRRVLEGLRKYHSQGNRCFWEDCLAMEMEAGDRYAGREGDVHFMCAFSPHGVLGEILIVFQERSDLGNVTSRDWEELGRGMTKIFRFFKAKHIDSFNFSLFSGGKAEADTRVFGRLCPRAVMPPWNTSDVNYFEKLHGEVICVVSPEDLNKELKAFFTTLPPNK
jgi:galactose-1-phosphate uridylyltransferase